MSRTNRCRANLFLFCCRNQDETIALYGHHVTKSRNRFITKSALTLLALTFSAVSLMSTADAATPKQYDFGTLMTNPAHAAAEAAAGQQSAMLELKWRLYEPTQGDFTDKDGYIAGLKADIATFKKNNMKITLGLGMHYAPAWVRQIPNGLYVNESGVTNANDINTVFNQKVRNAGNAYIKRVLSDLGVNNFDTIRLTSGGNAEVLYPTENYWAFDVNAQNGADMPPTMGRNPAKGWNPKSGKPITDYGNTTVAAWANWYIKALSNTIDWQMRSINQWGYTGQFEIITPGKGERPNAFAADVAGGLSKPSLIGRGAVWDKVYAGITDKSRAIVYVSSLGESRTSTSPCLPTDKNVALTNSASWGWGATRWLARIADEYGMKKSGENPGLGNPPDATYKDSGSNGMMAAAVESMKSCGFEGMYWAHDDQLWGGTIPYSQYAAAIAAANGEHGLTGKYYDNQNFSGLKTTRVDANLNFTWLEGAPATGMGSDTFSAEWTGRLIVPDTGLYTFTTSSDDGVRVWIDGVRVVDRWSGGYSQGTGSITLSPTKAHTIVVDYYEVSGPATMKLFWSGPGVAYQIVATANLLAK